MKKFFLTTVTAMAVMMFLPSCGGGSSSTENAEETEVSSDEDESKPKTVEVSVVDGAFEGGDLAAYVELVSGQYNIERETWSAKAEVKAKVKGQTDDELSGDSKFAVYDADGNELGVMSIYGGQTALNKALKSGDTDSEYTLILKYYESSAPMDEFMAKAKTIKGIDAAKSESRRSSSSADEDEDSSSSSSSSSSGSSGLNDTGLRQFISDGKSGDIDKMISALEWLYKTEAGLKPKVRALDEEAIKCAIELDKASEEIGKKYGTFTLAGALDSKTDEMSNSQLSRYNKVCGKVVVYFTISDNMEEYNSIYRRLRYGF